MPFETQARMKTTCPSCQQEYLLQPATCTNCSYPFAGSPSEKAWHLVRFKTACGSDARAADLLKRPRQILYAMALISTGYHIFIFFGGGFVLGDLALNIGLIAVFAVSARNLHRNPLLFAAVPLVLFGLINAMQFIVYPDLLYQGLLPKIFVASCLLVALRLVVKTQNLQGEFRVE